MFRKLSVIFLLLILILTRAGNMDVKVYKGTSRYQSKVICTVHDGKVYKKTSVYRTDIVYTVRKGKIYKGKSVYRSDIRHTVREEINLERTLQFSKQAGYRSLSFFLSMTRIGES